MTSPRPIRGHLHQVDQEPRLRHGLQLLGHPHRRRTHSSTRESKTQTKTTQTFTVTIADQTTGGNTGATEIEIYDTR